MGRQHGSASHYLYTRLQREPPNYINITQQYRFTSERVNRDSSPGLAASASPSPLVVEYRLHLRIRARACWRLCLCLERDATESRKAKGSLQVKDKELILA